MISIEVLLLRFQLMLFQKVMVIPYAGIILHSLLKRLCEEQNPGLVKMLITWYPVISNLFAHGA